MINKSTNFYIVHESPDLNVTLNHAIVSKESCAVNRVKYNGELVESHLPDPGRLKELLIPGVTLLIKKEGNPDRKTKFSTQAVYLGEQLISLNSWLPNKFVEFLLKIKSIYFLELTIFFNSSGTKLKSL